MEELNLVDKECPEPFLRTVGKLMQMKEGRLKVVYRDPKCDEMIMQAVDLMGCKLVEHKQDGNVFEVVLEKVSDEKPKDVKLSGC